EGAGLHDGVEVFRCHALDIFVGAAVDKIEQAREAVAEIEAAAAAMTDVEDPPHLLVQLRRIGEVGIAPVDDLAGGGFETAFAGHEQLQENTGPSSPSPGAKRPGRGGGCSWPARSAVKPAKAGGGY